MQILQDIFFYTSSLTLLPSDLFSYVNLFVNIQENLGLFLIHIYICTQITNLKQQQHEKNDH